MEKIREFLTPTTSSPKGGSAGFIEVYFLGIALVILGHSVYWSLGFQLGFWEFFTSTMIVSVAFFILCACLSEMTGILPFSGGAYGFARVTTGPYWGFVVGFMDSVSNILYVTLYVRSIVDFIILSFSLTSPTNLYPLWWFLVYLGMFFLHLVLKKYSFKFISIMGFICLMLPLIYIFGTAHLQDFKTNVTDQEEFVHHVKFLGGAESFMGIVPFSSILYFGVDMICLACEDTVNASVTVPRVIMAVMTTLFVLAIVLLFCVASQPPGILAAGHIFLPLNIGFATLFHTTFEKATITILPAYFIINYSIMYVYGRQMCALARSSLLPKVFAWTTSIGNVPYMAIGLGNLVGMLVVLWQWFGTNTKADFDETGKNLFYTAQMCSVTVYVISIISFIVFRYKYSTLRRNFVNYLGIPSAVVGIALYVFIWIASGFYQFNYFPIKCFSALFGLASVYYWAYARQNQRFSPEEESILLTVYVIKANSKHRTMYTWVKKRINKWMTSVDPQGVFFRPSTSKKTGSSSNAAESKQKSNERAAAGGGGGGSGSEGVSPAVKESRGHSNCVNYGYGSANESEYNADNVKRGDENAGEGGGADAELVIVSAPVVVAASMSVNPAVEEKLMLPGLDPELDAMAEGTIRSKAVPVQQQEGSGGGGGSVVLASSE